MPAFATEKNASTAATVSTPLNACPPITSAAAAIGVVVPASCVMGTTPTITIVARR